MKKILTLFVVVLMQCGFLLPVAFSQDVHGRFHDEIINPGKAVFQFFLKNDKGDVIRAMDSLMAFVHRKGLRIRFATNGGMFESGGLPVGLYIENGDIKNAVNNKDGDGNFYYKPNGVFYITSSGKASVMETDSYNKSKPEEIKFATQSGPTLVIKGIVHQSKAFDPKSTKRYIRNGVGILPNGDVVFSISQAPVTFFELASHFLSIGCVDALYLDGAGSCMYSNNDYIKLQGQRDNRDYPNGVMIAVVEK